MELHGYQRLIATSLIGTSVFFVGVSYWKYGFEAQAVLQLSHMIPLLFAGLMLGRIAVWITCLATVCAMGAGLMTDLKLNPDAQLVEAATPLLQPALASLIIALILDRLISKSDYANQRRRELDLVCEELELEIRAKEEKQAQLIHSQKMEALGKLASGIAHDFNNLLSVIIGYVTDPLNLISPQITLDNLEGAELAARRGCDVTRRLLSLSRGGGPVVTFDAGVALHEVYPLVRSLFKSKNNVVIDIPDESFPVQMDQQEFELAILNIATNARDAMPNGGDFKVSLSNNGRQVSVLFSDTGTGMSPETSARIFEPFFTTKPEGTGTGIGMAVVYQSIIEAGGSICVESTDFRGSTIRIDLPTAS